MRITDTAIKSPLGEILVDQGVISQAQREKALGISRKTGERLGEVLVEMGVATTEDVARALAAQTGNPYIRLRKGVVDPRVVHVLPREKAEQWIVLPLFRIHDKLTLAVEDPNKIFILDTIHKLTGCEIQPAVSPGPDILRLIEEVYGQSDVSMENLASELDEANLEIVSAEHAQEAEDIAELAGESPIINLVNQMILKAINERASDIHIEPERTFFRMRFRIDGVLYEVMRQRIEVHAPVVSRLKLMANVDIAERRLPQDGRIQVLAQGRSVDLRLSSMPGVLGEKLVLRLLDQDRGVLSLQELGFGSETQSAFRTLLRRPNGLVLVTGPTGSGKTTTLYAALKELNSSEKNIVTIEDPVEYQFEIINQNQVKEEIGLTFARILKHTLRQDPDILMVGEIRDAETAQIAVQAALTGHLVLSTMHTNDSASSINRLLEMGIEPYLLAPSLIGVLAQRLVRRLCPDCITDYHPTQIELEALGMAGKTGLRLRKSGGCTACFDSGYRDRLGVYELLVADQHFQSLLLRNPTLDQIREHQMSLKLPTLRSEAVKRVLEGQTTLEEIGRAVHID